MPVAFVHLHVEPLLDSLQFPDLQSGSATHIASTPPRVVVVVVASGVVVLVLVVEEE